MVDDLPADIWARTLSFIVRSGHDVSTLGSVDTRFNELARNDQSWEGSSVCVFTGDLDELEDHHVFERLVPCWKYCEGAFVDFEGAHVGARRLAAGRCFELLGQVSQQIIRLSIKNWLMFERTGLLVLQRQFPKLRHLEITGCDQISTYDSIIPVFQEHPCLLSFRATFQPRAKAGMSFAEAVPNTMMMLGFINFENHDVLISVLERCPLKHLWFASNGHFLPSMKNALRTACARRLETLTLPSMVKEDDCMEVATAFPDLQLLCRMRIGTADSPFGTGALSVAFEHVPEGQGVVVRPRGSTATLSANGGLWSFYSDGQGLVVAPKPNPSQKKVPNAGAPSCSKPPGSPRILVRCRLSSSPPWMAKLLADNAAMRQR
eukprot:TRINITY_DN13831_c0_g1_i1.p1 TRINITY_DN13831_c0_g1~~TRINITY_DN13831_c0_g1_i1.p1  ORF type:complete len:416 (+),score=38.43 TRINITY_DN13831_c0_g1_i1:118-1248(+)